MHGEELKFFEKASTSDLLKPFANEKVGVINEWGGRGCRNKVKYIILVQFKFDTGKKLDQLMQVFLLIICCLSTSSCNNSELF
jgi:hypothetical protein